VDTILKEESERVNECLDVSTHDKLMEVIQELMITQNAQRILHHSNFEQFIAEERTDDLKRIFNLFKIVEDKKEEEDDR